MTRTITADGGEGASKSFQSEREDDNKIRRSRERLKEIVTFLETTWERVSPFNEARVKPNTCMTRHISLEDFPTY